MTSTDPIHNNSAHVVRRTLGLGVRRTRGLGVAGMVAAVILAIIGIFIGEGSGGADTRSLERIGMLLPLTVYTCWWVFSAISSMRTKADAVHETTAAASAVALEAVFNAAGLAAVDVPEPGSAGRPVLIEIDDETRASYRNSLNRPVSGVPDEMRPGFRKAG